jgi:hypothetical protein
MPILEGEAAKSVVYDEMGSVYVDVVLFDEVVLYAEVVLYDEVGAP